MASDRNPPTLPELFARVRAALLNDDAVAALAEIAERQRGHQYPCDCGECHALRVACKGEGANGEDDGECPARADDGRGYHPRGQERTVV